MKKVLLSGLALSVLLFAVLFLRFSQFSPLFSYFQSSFRELISENSLPPSKGLEDGQLELIWLGTAGVYIGDGESGILIDPFVSKFGMTHIVLDKAIESDPESILKLKDRLKGKPVDMVLVSHSHYDHSLDAPAIAKMYSVPILGSESTKSISLLKGHEKTAVVGHGSKARIGKFTIEFRNGNHGDAVVDAFSFPGVVKPTDSLSGASSYKMGQVFAIHIDHPNLKVVHQASVGFMKDTYDGLDADVILLGIALRKSSFELTKRVVDDLGVRQIIPLHFDDFFVASEISEMPFINLQEYLTTVKENFPKLEVNFAPIHEVTSIGN